MKKTVLLLSIGLLNSLTVLAQAAPEKKNDLKIEVSEKLLSVSNKDDVIKETKITAGDKTEILKMKLKDLEEQYRVETTVYKKKNGEETKIENVSLVIYPNSTTNYSSTSKIPLVTLIKLDEKEKDKKNVVVDVLELGNSYTYILRKDKNNVYMQYAYSISELSQIEKLNVENMNNVKVSLDLPNIRIYNSGLNSVKLELGKEMVLLEDENKKVVAKVSNY